MKSVFGEQGGMGMGGARGTRCPRCGSHDVEREETGIVPLPASPLTMFDGTHVAPVSEFRCRSCGYAWEDVF